MTFRLLAVAVFLALLPDAAPALEKAARPAPDLDRPGSDEWARGCSSSIIYYNFCTGWLWAWAGWEPGETIGVVYRTRECSDVLSLSSSWHCAMAATPPGYGYTGTVEVTATVAGCPVGPRVSQPMLPTAGWSQLAWGVWVLGDFVVLWTNADVSGNPTIWATDHPSAGPTGPPACGHCYPESRSTHSFRFGTPGAPLCPGLPFEAGSACAPELLWDVQGSFVERDTPLGLEANTWSRVKAMYR